MWSGAFSRLLISISVLISHYFYYQYFLLEKYIVISLQLPSWNGEIQYNELNLIEDLAIQL